MDFINADFAIVRFCFCYFFVYMKYRQQDKTLSPKYTFFVDFALFYVMFHLNNLFFCNFLQFFESREFLLSIIKVSRSISVIKFIRSIKIYEDMCAL